MGSRIRQVIVMMSERKLRSYRTVRRRKNENSFSVPQGLILIFGVGVFVALVFVLVWYVWYLPVEKSLLH